MMHGLARQIIRARLLLLLVAAAMLAAAWLPARSLQFDRRVEQMFPPGDPAVEGYATLRDRFGGNAVAMLVYRDPELFTPEGIERVARRSAQVAEIPGVRGVLSLAQVDEALGSTRPGQLLGLEAGPAILGDDALARGFRDLFSAYTHDADGQWASIVALLEPGGPDEVDHAPTIAALRRLAAELPSEHQPAALVGEPVLVSEGFTLAEEDGRRLSRVTIVLLSIVVLLLFRDLRWVVVQAIVILWAVTITRGTIHVAGLRMSMVSSMLTAIVTVIAVAALIHVAVAYRRYRRRGNSPPESMERTFALLLPPIAWTAATDAAGFAALLVSQVGPVRDFGLMMALGAGAVLLGIVLIVPGLLLLVPSDRAGREPRADAFLRGRLLGWAMRVGRHRRLAFAVAAALAVLTGIGLQRLETETNFIRNFRATSDLARDYDLVETRLGGAGVWDVLLPAPATLSPAYLDEVRQLQQELRQLEVPGYPAARLTKVLSLADADATAAEAPLLALAPPPMRIAGMRAAMPAFVDALLTPAESPEPRLMRIMLRSPERLPAEAKLALIAAAEQAVARRTGSPAWRQALGGGERAGEAAAADAEEVPAPADRRPIATTGEVTGYYVLLARLVDGLVADQWLCLLVAAVAVLLMMIVATRSLWLGTLAMIPNLLPVLAVLGTLGLLGIKLNMGGAMIAAVSLGLSIDGSIHFLARYRRARQREERDREARDRGKGALPPADTIAGPVLHAQRQVGMPVVLATAALVLGFSVLTTSPFIPTVTFGVLVTAALLVGTAANLTLLPLLADFVHRRP